MASAKDQDPQELAPQEHAPKIIEEQGEFALTLEEYCTRVSATDRRVELLNAFAKSEIAAGHRKDVALSLIHI